MTDQPEIDLAAEVTEFTSLLRARIVGAVDDEHPSGQSPGEALWNSVHAVDRIEASSMQELADRFGDLLYVKRNIAVLVAAMLALDLAKQTDRSALDHINDVEQALIDGTPA